MLKIEGIGQIDFSADRLLLKRSENMRRKYGPPLLHLAFLLQLIVSEGDADWPANIFARGADRGCRCLNCSELCLQSGVNK